MRCRVYLAAAILESLALLVSSCGSSSPRGVKVTPNSGIVTIATATALRTSFAPWNRPTNQDELVKAAGLSLAPQETLAVHYHAHLDVIVDGSPVQVPAGLGINAGPNGALPKHGSPGISPLHTHDATGVIHIEAPRRMAVRLGQLATEWGVLLRDGRIGGYVRGDHHRDVQVYVDGKRYVGNPAHLVLSAHQEIAVVAGPPSNTGDIPSSFTFDEGE